MGLELIITRADGQEVYMCKIINFYDHVPLSRIYEVMDRFKQAKKQTTKKPIKKLKVGGGK